MRREPRKRGAGVLVEPGPVSYLVDPLVAKRRILGEAWLDEALLGSARNETGERVLIYSEPDLLDLLAERMMEGTFGSRGPLDESEAYDSAVELVECAREDSRPDARYVVVTEPLHDEAYYHDRGRSTYLVEGGFRVVQPDLSEEDDIE